VIVTLQTLASTLATLRSSPRLAVDTETTGLRPYHGDMPFAIIVADWDHEYYFNLAESCAWRPAAAQLQEDLFSHEKTWYFANAKFDLAMLAKMGLVPRGTIHDLAVHERLLDSTLFGQVFSLDAMAERRGKKKDGGPKAWCEKNGAVTRVPVEGKQTTVKQYHFDRVPLGIIVPYAKLDARLTFDIGREQEAAFVLAELPDIPSLAPLVVNERQLTETVYAMEAVGVKVDLAFCRRAAVHEGQRYAEALRGFELIAGKPFVNSANCLAPLFAGQTLRLTPKGHPCFDAEALSTYTGPVAKLVTDIRGFKGASDYYHGFLYHADADGVIHAGFNQHQARTGRFSSSAPNLQNLTKSDEEELEDEFVVRRAFVPRPGYFFAMFDFHQMEYRLMLDYSGARGLIDKILGGLDIHQATADLAGITRSQAKTANFLTIYGGGDGVLAAKLGVTVGEAARIRAAIKAAAPENAAFIDECEAVARRRGFVYGWFGRRHYFPDQNDSYRAPNAVIQGGCADVIKLAMNRVARLLRGTMSRMVLTIHDELVIETHEGDSRLLAEIKGLMEEAYLHRHIPLTVGVDHSFKSLADKTEGYP